MSPQLIPSDYQEPLLVTTTLVEPYQRSVSDDQPLTKNGTDHDAHQLQSASSHADGYRLYAERWWVLFVFCLISFGQSLIWITYSPITDEAKSYYNITEAQVDLLLNWGTIFYVAFAPFCIHIGRSADGLRRLVIAAAFFEFAAVILRVIPEIFHSSLHPYAIYFLNVAHISNACACPPITVTVTKLSAVWMGEDERTVTTCIAVVMNNVGTAVGMVIGPYLVSTADEMPHLLYAHLGFGCFTLLCTLARFPASPVTPPTPAAEVMFHKVPEPYLTSIRLVLATPTFLILSIGAGGMMGIFNGWSGVLETGLSSEYSDSTIGWLSFSATVAGIVGGIVHGRIAQIEYFRRRLKLLIVILSFCAFLSVTWFTLSFASIFRSSAILPANEYSVAISITLIGWFVGSAFPLAFELSAELTYPLSESVSGGILNMIFNGVGVIFLFVAPNVSGPTMNFILLATCTMGICMLPFVQERYHRAQAEELSKSQHHALTDGDEHISKNGTSAAVAPSPILLASGEFTHHLQHPATTNNNTNNKRSMN